MAKEAADAVAEQEIVNAGGEAVFKEKDETTTHEFISYNVRNRPSKFEVEFRDSGRVSGVLLLHPKAFKTARGHSDTAVKVGEGRSRRKKQVTRSRRR